MLATNLEIPLGRIEAFCRRWRIAEMALFGSVLREDFRPDSDVDVLVTFEQDADWSIFDLMRVEEELSTLLGRKVDLVERRLVDQSENYIRRQQILSTAEPVYVAR